MTISPICNNEKMSTMMKILTSKDIDGNDRLFVFSTVFKCILIAIT